jgi:hypothetical protein
MRVRDLIARLQEMPEDIPVMLKVYGMGQDSWYYLEETQIMDMVHEETSTRICEIDVRNS